VIVKSPFITVNAVPAGTPVFPGPGWPPDNTIGGDGGATVPPDPEPEPEPDPEPDPDPDVVPPEPDVVPDPEVVEPEPVVVPVPFLVVVLLVVVVFVVVLVVALVVVATGATTAFATTLGAFGVTTFGTDVADRLLGRTAVVTNVAVSTCTGVTASGNWPSPIGDPAVSTNSRVGLAAPSAPAEIPVRAVRVVDLDAGPLAVTRPGARVGKFCLAVADSDPGPELARVLVAAVDTPPERAATAPTDATHLTSVARRLFSSARRCISAVMRRCRPGAVLRRCLLAACLLTGWGR
jgi:hypothetical protein